MVQTLMYGVPSGCSFGSIVALEWLGEPYRLCRIEMPEVVHSDAYRQINPVGETPVLVTATSEPICESMAILHHLGARGIGKGLSYTQGTPGFDRLNQVLAFLNTSFFAAFGPLWYALEHGIKGSDKDVLRAYGAAKVAKAHADLEQMLADTEWLLGDRRTLADAYFIGIARWTKYHDVVDRSDYPGLQRLFEKLEADPAVRFAHAVEQGETAVSGGGFLGEVTLDDVLRQQALAA